MRHITAAICIRSAAGLLATATLTDCLAAPLTAPAPQPASNSGTPKARADHTGAARHPDRSGKPRKGQASYYAKKFARKKMADGTPMNPQADIAASKTLPLGTTAQVTNLENGKRAIVEIRDRGPYEKGRIVDLSPQTAEKLEMTQQGVAPVEIKPLALPPPETASKAENKADSQHKSAEAERTPRKPVN